MDAETLRRRKLDAGKLAVDVGLVRRLVAAQFPQWAELPITPVAQDGWDNWTFHLGDRMKVRLPSAEAYVAQSVIEAEFLPQLASQLPVALPTPLGIGLPGEGYPWKWTVYDWLEGERASEASIADKVAFAGDVAGFLAALQAADTTGAPLAGEQVFWRGAPVVVYQADMERSFAALGDRIDVAGAQSVWAAATASWWRGPDVWFHGDIAIGNLLVRDGRLQAVIDFGTAAVGDPACDLVIAWTFFDGASREAFRHAMPDDAEMWARARGWAIWKAMLLLAGTASDAGSAAVIDAVIAEHRAAP